MIYSAITGDIVNSRKHENRSQLIKNLKKAVKKINNQYQDVLAAHFVIYSGDELQGLLKDPAYSYLIIREIQKMMYPVELHFGVGIGELSTSVPANLDNAYTGELDGQAYYWAREMLNQAKISKQNVFFHFNN